MKRRMILLLVLLALVAGVYRAVPPRARSLPAPPLGLKIPVRGVMHVHTRRSDGTGTVDEAAAAAARAELNFVIFTDHGDATRAPESPSYREGVLCIDAVEISTEGGHIIALGLPRAPYPLAGETRDVLEDIARMGGFSIVAHPGSRKPELRLVEWGTRFDGLEWLNADSEWRDETRAALARVLFAYPFRGAESLALLFDRPDDVMRRWDALTGRRRVVALAGNDAHARVGLRSLGEPYDRTAAFHVPSYETSFRTFSLALPQAVLNGVAAADATIVLDQIRRGHVYTVVDALAGPAAFAFSATSGRQSAVAGEPLTIDGPVTLRVDVQAPADATVTMYRDGNRLVDTDGPSLQYVAEPRPAVFRVEVKLPGSPGAPPVPWIVSNPIYVGRSPTEPIAPPAHGAARTSAVVYQNGAARGWDIEHSRDSQGAVDVVDAVGGTQLLFRYALSGASSSSPFVAAAVPAGPALAGYDRLTFKALADRPMRLSVQLRAPSSAAGERWHRSVYLDSTPREISVFFDDLRPRDATTQARPPLQEVRSLLFVVDTVNTKAGTNGSVWIDNVRFEK